MSFNDNSQLDPGRVRTGGRGGRGVAVGGGLGGVVLPVSYTHLRAHETN